MRILSLSTSSNKCSVAILENDVLIKQLSSNNLKTHSEILVPLLDKLLLETKLELDEIDYLACDIGPRFIYWHSYRSYYSVKLFRKYISFQFVQFLL